jgi:serine/threonine-protein kinase RsbW
MRSVRRYGARAQAIPAARHYVADVLGGLDPDTVYAVQLMVSELATNCVRHGGTPFDLTIDLRPREVRVEVTDIGPGTPTVRSPSPTDPTGRGLRIVESLSNQWGVETRPDHPGKKVWFTYRI